MRNPVAVYTAVMAGGAVLAGSADFADLVPPTALKWFLIVYGVVGAVGGVWVRSQVTPLADPRDASKRPLIVDPDPRAKAKRDAGVGL